MIVFDASVLIAYLDRRDVHHDAAVQLLEREVDDDFAASTITLAEVLLGPARRQQIDEASAALHDLEIGDEPFPPNTATRLAELRATTGLRMPDCCVLLVAKESTARVAAFDSRLLKAARALGLDAIAS